MSKLRLVILDSAYSKWHSKQVRDFYCDLIQLKYDAYRGSYRTGVLAVSDSDQVAVHKVLCEERDGRLMPLLGNYTITASRAAFHNLEFPALSLARASKSDQHVKAMTAIMDACSARAQELGYDAGYALNPAAKNEAVELRETFKGIKPLFSEHFQIRENITAATVRFKVEKICSFWGYESLSLAGKPLSTIGVPRFDGEEVLLMHLRKYTKEALDYSHGFKALWDSRIELLGAAVPIKKAA